MGEAIETARPFAVDVASGTEADARAQGPGEAGGVRARRSEAADARAGAGRRERARRVERRFGPYGGRYVPETLIPALDELERAWVEARADPDFTGELARLLRDYVGRPDAALPRRAGCPRWSAARSG